MAPTPSLVIKKTMTYRDVLRVWSNRYHFNGGTPADSAHWETFMDLVVADEAAAHDAAVEIVEAIGYTATSTVAAHSKSYSTVGTIGSVTGAYPPGDVAALLRYSTTARTSNGHPVYLFNYFHVYKMDHDDQDKVDATFKAALEEYGDDWIAGYSDGTNTYVRAGPNGATAVSRTVNQFLTHRDFPR